MAKIALLAKKISPQALGLAQALRFHRHDVTFITSASEAVPDNLGYPVLTYFKRWSALEALKFFPRILGQAPDVWHFVFADDQEEMPTGAHWVLSTLARALPGRVIAASFYDSLFQIPSHRLAFFTKSCDIVTTATRENLMFLKRRGWLGRYAETEVLPPFLFSPQLTEVSSQDQDLAQMIAAIQPYVVVASERLPDLDWEEILPQIKVVVCGVRPDRPTRPMPKGLYYVGHHLLEGQMRQLLRGSRGLLAAYDEYSVVELQHLHRLCSETKKPILANHRQAEALPGFCVNKRNGFLLDQSLKSFKQLLHDNEKLDLPQPLFEAIKSDLTDSALNELNRLYAKIHHLKTSSFDMKRSPLS